MACSKVILMTADWLVHRTEPASPIAFIQLTGREISASNVGVGRGGEGKPSGCIAIRHVALVAPSEPPLAPGCEGEGGERLRCSPAARATV